MVPSRAHRGGGNLWKPGVLNRGLHNLLKLQPPAVATWKCHWKQMYVSWFLGFLGMKHFRALSAVLREQYQPCSGIVRQNQALSGIFRGMILQDLPWFHMILHDPFGAQGPRNVSKDGKKMEPFVLFAFSPLFVVIFVQFEANFCGDVSCGLIGFPLLSRHFCCLAVLETKFSYVVSDLLGTGPPDLTHPWARLALPSSGSMWHRNRGSWCWINSNRCWIDAKSTREEGRARRVQGWGLGGVCA